jgi:hypothetical protein
VFVHAGHEDDDGDPYPVRSPILGGAVRDMLWAAVSPMSEYIVPPVSTPLATLLADRSVHRNFDMYTMSGLVGHDAQKSGASSYP